MGRMVCQDSMKKENNKKFKNKGWKWFENTEFIYCNGT